jgi:hypothetical protein
MMKMTGLILACLAALPLQDSRLPVPEAGKVKEAEKAVKELFKAEYARKAPADRASLARLLLQSATSQTNPAERWVCLSQAQELAAQAGEWEVAWDAVFQIAAAFEGDGTALKLALLTQAGKSVKTTDEAGKIAERSLKFADELLRQDAVDSAEKAVASAQQLAKKSASPPLMTQAAAKSKELADLKAGLEKSKKVREALAKNPDDPAANLEYGLFLCLARGQWDKGLPHLARGTEGPFRTIAARELGSPEGAADQASLGDFWWDQAEKETGPAKASARARAAHWYDKALAGLDGLPRVRAEKRLTESELAQNGFLDLLRLIDPAKDSVATTWKVEGGVLTNGMNFRCRLQIPYQPPEEYDLTFQLATTGEGNPMVFGLVGGAVQFNVALEGWGRHIITATGKKEINPPFTKALQYGAGDAFGKENTIVIAVRKKGFTFTVNGTKSMSWEGQYSALANSTEWAVPDPKALWIGAWDRPLQIRKIGLTPITGQGRRLR